MLKIKRKVNEVVLPTGRSVFLISHSGVNGWSRKTVKKINNLIANKEYIAIAYYEDGVIFYSIDAKINIIGLYDIKNDINWSHKTRACSPSWVGSLLGERV